MRALALHKAIVPTQTSTLVGPEWHPPMSALGQKRTCAVQNVMSALPPNQTCPLVPIADIAFSFDHLVGGDQQAGRNSDAERLRCSHVDGCFEFGRGLHREVGRFVAA